MTTVLQEIIEKCMDEISNENDEDTDENLPKIPVILFECLEPLYELIHHDDRLTFESYKWIVSFCKKI